MHLMVHETHGIHESNAEKPFQSNGARSGKLANQYRIDAPLNELKAAASEYGQVRRVHILHRISCFQRVRAGKPQRSADELIILKPLYGFDAERLGVIVHECNGDVPLANDSLDLLAQQVSHLFAGFHLIETRGGFCQQFQVFKVFSIWVRYICGRFAPSLHSRSASLRILGAIGYPLAPPNYQSTAGKPAYKEIIAHINGPIWSCC